jgi:TIR domain
MAPPIRDKVFISYSHKDQEWLAQLQNMMKPLVRSGAVLPWADTMIRTGADWHEQIQTALTTAKVGVILVSSNFLASDFIAEVELPALLTAAAEEGLQVCWILVSACLHETSGLSGFQAAHDISRPLDSLTLQSRMESSPASPVKSTVSPTHRPPHRWNRRPSAVSSRCSFVIWWTQPSSRSAWISKMQAR